MSSYNTLSGLLYRYSYFQEKPQIIHAEGSFCELITNRKIWSKFFGGTLKKRQKHHQRSNPSRERIHILLGKAGKSSSSRLPKKGIYDVLVPRRVNLPKSSITFTFTKCLPPPTCLSCTKDINWHFHCTPKFTNMTNWTIFPSSIGNIYIDSFKWWNFPASHLSFQGGTPKKTYRASKPRHQHLYHWRNSRRTPGRLIIHHHPWRSWGFLIVMLEKTHPPIESNWAL